MHARRESLLEAIRWERERTEKLVFYGTYPYSLADPEAPNEFRLASLIEELGHVARNVAMNNGAAEMQRNLVQLAASAVAWAESLDA